MHPKSADFGKICSPCMQNALQNAVGECISRVSCHEDPLFPSASLKSCTVGKSCHSFSTCLSCGSFAIPACAGAQGATGITARPSLGYWRVPYVKVQTLWLVLYVGVLASRFALYVEALTSWFILRWGVSVVVRSLPGGASAAVRSLCRNVSAATEKSRADGRRLPWRDLAVVHS